MSDTPAPERKTVILTGASRGIGHATVQRFSQEGWRVITCSRETIPEDCKADPNWTHHIAADLGDPDSRADFVREANKVLAGVADRVYTAFPDVMKQAQWVGNPLRAAFL